GIQIGRPNPNNAITSLCKRRVNMVVCQEWQQPDFINCRSSGGIVAENIYLEPMASGARFNPARIIGYDDTSDGDLSNVISSVLTAPVYVRNMGVYDTRSVNWSYERDIGSRWSQRDVQVVNTWIETQGTSPTIDAAPFTQSGVFQVPTTGSAAINGATGGLEDMAVRDIYGNVRDLSSAGANVDVGPFESTGGVDVTPPTLTSPIDAANGAAASTGSVITNDGTGTLYHVITTSATSPSAAQVKAGNDHTATAATDSGSQVVSSTGIKSIVGSGLSSSTQYYTHYMHEDSNGNQSTVASASGFTTAAPDTTAPTLSSATDAANGSSAMTGTVSTDEGNGTLYWFISTSATPPSATDLKAGTGATASGSQVVSATGVQNVADAGLTAETTYYTHYLHGDAAGNDSSIVSASGFTTTAASSFVGPTFVGASSDTASSSSVAATLTGLTAGSDRKFLVAVTMVTGSGLTVSVDVDGVTATEISGTDSGGTVNSRTMWFEASKDTGTDFDVTASFTGGTTRALVSVYQATGSQALAFDTFESASAPRDVDLSATVLSGDEVLVATVGNAVGTWTFTGASEDVQFDLNSNEYTATADTGSLTAGTETITISSANNNRQKAHSGIIVRAS
ncbi:MAG: hypothetical protein AAFR21_14905, partial [Pseudomonadota bacterium]